MQPKPTQTPKSKMIPKTDADVDNEIENNGVKNEEQEEEDEAGMISEGDSWTILVRKWLLRTESRFLSVFIRRTD